MLRFFKPVLIARNAAQFGFHAGLAVMLGLAFVAQQANAAPLPVYTTGLQSGQGVQGGGDYSVGGAFKYTGSGDAITALGIWDQNQNGLASAHDIGLWDFATSTLLATINVPAGTVGTLIGEYRYVNLSSPVVLTTGTEYVLGANMNGGDNLVIGDGNWPVGYAAPFTYPASGFNSGLYGVPGSAEPTIDPFTPFEPLALGVPYLGPNALFVPIPEPASGLLLLIGAPLAWGVRARSRKR